MSQGLGLPDWLCGNPGAPAATFARSEPRESADMSRSVEPCRTGEVLRLRPLRCGFRILCYPCELASGGFCLSFFVHQKARTRMHQCPLPLRDHSPVVPGGESKCKT